MNATRKKETAGRKKPGPASFDLPEGFEPTLLEADALRFGVSVSTLRRAMIRAGIPVPPAGQPAFVLPEGFVPTTLAKDSERLGVLRQTLLGAMLREGMRWGPEYRRRATLPGWVADLQG